MRDGERLVAPAALFDVASPALVLRPRRMVLGECGGLRLWPACFVLDDAQVLPEPGLVALADRLLVEGLAVNPRLLAQGHYAQARPAGDGRYRVPPPSAVIDEPVALVGGDVTGNYYHWLFDVLPRMVALARHGAALAGGVMPACLVAAPRPAFADALLALAGLSRVIDVAAGETPLARRLIVVSNFTQYGFVHPASFDVLPPPPPPPGRRRRLYVSRHDATTRRLANEAQVTAALAPLGVERVALAGLSLAAQRALFAEAELIVGPHGAGLGNILWAPADCGLVELRPQVAALWQFERYCAAAGRRFAVVTAPPRQCRRPGWANSDFVLRPARVVAAVAALLGQAPPG